MSRIECRCVECHKVTEVFGSRWCSSCYHPLKERHLQELLAGFGKGFVLAVVKFAEWLKPGPEQEGERILWSDGSIRSVPERGSEYVTVLKESK